MIISQKRDAAIPRRLKLSRLATFFAFVQMGALILMWSTSTSALRNFQDWEGAEGDTSFGALAFSIGLGFAIGCAISGPIIDRLGCRNVAVPVLVVHPLLYLLLVGFNGMIGLFASGLLIGIFRGFVDIVANVNAVQLERHYRRPIMSAFHAAYPAAGFVFGFVGSAFAQNFTESPLVAYAVIGGALSILGFVFGRWYLIKEDELPTQAISIVPPRSADEAVSAENASKLSAGSVASRVSLWLIIGLGVLAFVSYLAESATYDWGQEFVRRTLDTSAGLAAIALTFFSGGQFIGRAIGDKFTARFGQRKVMFFSGLFGSLGAALMITAAHPYQAILGFGIIGLGVSCIVPLMLSAAGRMDPEKSGRNIGLVNAIGVTGMFVGPAGITAVVSTLGVEWMPILPLCLLAVIAVVGPMLIKAAPSFKAESTEEKSPDLLHRLGKGYDRP